MKLLCVGNSHVGMLRQALDAFPKGTRIDFAAGQIYHGQKKTVRQLLSSGKADLRITIPRFEKAFLGGPVSLLDYDGIILVGLPGGPGDGFRAIAPSAFVGTTDDTRVPRPREVECPVYRPDTLSNDNPPVSRSVLEAACASFLRTAQKQWIDPVVPGLPMVVVPTPPMAEAGVVRRFGPAVLASDTGFAMLDIWKRTIIEAIDRRPKTRKVDVPLEATARGWMLNRYLRVDEPTEFHANGDYARLFCTEIADHFSDMA